MKGDLTMYWEKQVYKVLGTRYTSGATRQQFHGQIYPFMRTQELRKSLNLLMPRAKFTYSKDYYKATATVIGKLGPVSGGAINSKNGVYNDYSDYLNENTIVKGYRTHAFNFLGVLIQENLDKAVGKRGI